MPFPESFGAGSLLRGRVEITAGEAVLALAGELDVATASAVEERLRELADASEGPVVLDMAELEFLGSTGVRAILTTELYLGQRDRPLILRHVEGMPRRTLEMTGLYPTLRIE